MKSIKPVKFIAGSLKGANELLKNAQKKAAELDQFKGEIVIITDAKGKSVQGFFKNIEFVIIDNKITARYTVYLILECEKLSWHQPILTMYMMQWIYGKHPLRTTGLMSIDGDVNQRGIKFDTPLIHLKHTF